MSDMTEDAARASKTLLARVGSSSAPHPQPFDHLILYWLQKRYAAGTKEILRRYFEGEELNPTDVIVSVSFIFSHMSLLYQPHVAV